MGVLPPKPTLKNVLKFTLYTPWKMGKEQPKKWKYARSPNLHSHDCGCYVVATTLQLHCMSVENIVVEISHDHDYFKS